MALIFFISIYLRISASEWEQCLDGAGSAAQILKKSVNGGFVELILNTRVLMFEFLFLADSV